VPRVRVLMQGRVDNGSVLKTIALPVLANAGQISGVSLGIDQLSALESLSAPMLASTPGGIAIRNNGTDPSAGPLKIVLGPITSASSLEIANNPHLQNIEAFSGLASVTWNIAIYGNEPLVAVNFPHLTSVGGSVSVKDQPDVAKIALPELTLVRQSVGKSLEFATMWRVTSISVPKLTSTPAGIIFYQVGSTQLPGDDPLVFDFRSLGSIGGPLDLNDLLGLVTLDGFPRLANIGGYFSLTSLFNLQSLPFPALATVTGNVVMVHVDAATEITLPALSRVSGGLLFDNNLAVTAIGLPFSRRSDKIRTTRYVARSCPCSAPFRRLAWCRRRRRSSLPAPERTYPRRQLRRSTLHRSRRSVDRSFSRPCRASRRLPDSPL